MEILWPTTTDNYNDNYNNTAANNYNNNTAANNYNNNTAANNYTDFTAIAIGAYRNSVSSLWYSGQLRQSPYHTRLSARREILRK